MFACCRPSALVPRDKLQLRHAVKLHKLSDMPGPPPTPGPIPILPLNKVEPPTPDHVRWSKLPCTAGFLPKFGKNKFDRKISQDPQKTGFF